MCLFKNCEIAINDDIMRQLNKSILLWTQLRQVFFPPKMYYVSNINCVGEMLCATHNSHWVIVLWIYCCGYKSTIRIQQPLSSLSIVPFSHLQRSSGICIWYYYGMGNIFRRCVWEMATLPGTIANIVKV